MRIEIYCEDCGNKLSEEDIDTRNPSPVYVSNCKKCLQIKEQSDVQPKTNQGRDPKPV